MIERLAVTDFGKHTSYVLDLDEHVTTLAGRTNSGKSTLLRALGFVALNSPSGAAVVRHGADFTKVTLVVDGVPVVRKQGSKTNLYKLGGKVYKAFGKGAVPDPVARLLNVGPVNFQDQDDGRFWLSLTPGQLAKELNEVFDLGVIDRTLHALASRLRRANSEEEVARDRLAAARETAKRLAWAEEFAADVARLQGIETELAGFRSRIASATLLIEKGSRARSARDRALNANVDAKTLCQTAGELLDTAGKASKLRKLLEVGTAAAKVKSVEVPDFTGLDVLRAKADQAAERRRTLEMLLAKATELKEESCRTQDELSETQGKLDGGGRCPVCQRPLKRGSPQKSSNKERTSAGSSTLMDADQEDTDSSGCSAKTTGRTGSHTQSHTDLELVNFPD